MAYRPQLVWARYNKNNKYYLLLHLGNFDGKSIALLSNAIPDTAAKMIKESVSKNTFKNIQHLMHWIKNELPDAYRNSYREFKSDQLKILNTYDI